MPRKTPTEPSVEVQEAPETQVETPERHFLVNPSGVIHEVTEAHFTDRMTEPGFRPATDKEIAAYILQ
ncbi:hypothetical protein SE17_05730 [Kouleothrix aurantiaca]|uniref:Uncharacterized protein n=1 Tax=Kouleothrix aurantiaca TaxID=186479 RepID=A0A0P9DEI9_9CHLR|nr:hypothetical protein SE17_05730 [Kouleothrix aurantiaca]